MKKHLMARAKELASLFDSLSDDDLTTIEDIDTMDDGEAEEYVDANTLMDLPPPEEFLRRARRVHGTVRSVEPEEREGVALVVSDQPERDTSPWIVGREAEEAALAKKLANVTVACVKGAAGSGKSTFARHMIRRSESFRSRFASIVVVDCFALRGRSIRSLERDAVATLFGNDEHGLHTYLLNCSNNERPLQSYVRSRFHDGPSLLVLDHIDMLNPAGEAALWLLQLEKLAEDVGSKVLLISRPLRRANKIHSYVSSQPQLELKALSIESLDAWWMQPRFEDWRSAGVFAADVQRVTGGVPRIVRDLGRFIASAKQNLTEPENLLDDFCERLSCEYAPEVERALDSLTELPERAKEPLKAPPTYHASLIDTGAFKSDAVGNMMFSSEILENRFRRITYRDGLLLRLLRASVSRMAAKLFKVQENVSSAVEQQFSREATPTAVWGVFVTCLKALGLSDVRIDIRDQSNSRIWKQVFAVDPERAKNNRRPAPLYADNHPLCAHAVRMGRVLSNEDGYVVVPLVGTKGRVSLLVRGEMGTESSNDFERRLLQRRIWNFCKTVEFSLAKSVEIAEARRADAHWRKVSYRINRTQTDSDDITPFSLTDETGCAAVLIIQWGPKGWFVRHMDIPETDSIQAVFSPDQIARFNTRLLDDIAGHPSGRGRVFTGGQVRDLFPHIGSSDNDLSAFAWPVPTTPLRVVTFLFAENKATELAGVGPLHLQLVAKRTAQRFSA